MHRVIFYLMTIILGLLSIPAIANAAPHQFRFPVAKAQEGVWQPQLTAQGRVIAEREVALSLPFTALIKTVPVYGDQAVKRGEVLARIDASPLIGLLANLKTAGSKVALAQQHLAIANQRFHEKLATRDDLIQAKETLNIATSDLKNAWLTVNNVLLQMGNTISEKKVLQELHDHSTQVVAQQKAAIRAPFDAIVARRNVGSGSRIASGQSLFVLDDMSRVFVSLLIPHEQLVAWQSGEVHTDTAYGSVNLSLLSKAPSIDSSTGLVNLKFQADNPNGQFLDGEWVDVTLEEKPMPAMWVPESAVVEREGKTYCILRRKGAYKTVEVKVGNRRNGRIPVISGVHAGNEVVVENAYLLLYRDLKALMIRAAD